jgi:hypothetical protein
MEHDHRLKATELFPELSDDMDRRIELSATKIKLWIIGGILANLVVAMGGAIPISYSLGQMTRSFEAAINKMQDSTERIDDMEDWARTQGYQPPRRESR